MSTLTHCDGPGCERTNDQPRRFCDGPWFHVSTPDFYGGYELDFHNRACLARWADPTAKEATHG